MRVLLLSQWCTPENAFKSVPFAKALTELGHNVHILTGFPNYPAGRVYPGYRVRLWQFERIDGIPIIRVALYPSHDYSLVGRMLNYWSFALSAAVLGPLLVPKVDVLLAYHPPTTVFLPALFFKWLRGIPVALDINDIWPFQLTSLRLFREKGMFYRLLDLFCRISYRQASRISVISPGYVSILRAQGVPEQKIRVIPNWCREDVLQSAFDRPLDSGAKKGGPFIVLFAGNMGHAQALDAVLEAARILQSRGANAEIHFVGDGIDKSRLQSRASEMSLANVRFFPACTQTELVGFYRRADVLLVHLGRARQLEIAIPSKIQDYLFVGKPILAAVRGSAAELVRQARAAVCCEPEDAESIADSIEHMSKLPPSVLRELGDNGKQFYLRELSLKRAAREFCALFAECLAERQQS